MKTFIPMFTLVLAAAPASAAAPQVGAAAAVRGAVSAVSQGGKAPRAMKSGSEVFLNDKVTTGKDARLQVLLLDETVFTVGPDSEMVIDEFVYDPETNTGQVTANAAKGAFRFVTGKVARKTPGNMKIKLPVGTIGIRGTIASFTATAKGAVVSLDGPGKRANNGAREGRVNVTSGGVTKTIFRPGWAITVEQGKAPSDPFRMTQEIRQNLQAKLDSKPKKADKEKDPAKDSDPDKDSGQDAAKAGGDLRHTTTIARLGDGLQKPAEQQAQDIINGEGGGTIASPEGTGKTWAEVRAAKTSGTGVFNGSNSGFTFIGNSGAAPHTHTGTIAMNVTANWASRTVGGTLNLDCTDCPTGGHDVQSNFSSFDFSNLSGDAVFQPTMNVTSCESGASCSLSGTTWEFVPTEGAGSELKVTVQFTQSSGGTITGETAQCTSGGNCGTLSVFDSGS